MREREVGGAWLEPPASGGVASVAPSLQRHLCVACTPLRATVRALRPERIVRPDFRGRMTANSRNASIFPILFLLFCFSISLRSFEEPLCA